MRRSDPRVRQTLNQISETLESANLSTQASLFTFSQNYVNPCLSSLNTCLEASCYPCFHFRDDRRLRRNRHGRSNQRGRPELSFDFYDDWDDDEGENGGLLGGWGNDELDRLLAGSGAHDAQAGQPRRHRAMNYGSRPRRKSTALPKDGTADPTIVPNSSMFGFLERLPWKIGGRGLRYKPSAADLQENVGKRNTVEGEPLIEESEEESRRSKHGRQRSGTTSSRTTTNSLSSRGDLFPSEDEDDAVPLDDEFAMILERRTTGSKSDDHSSGRTRGKRPSASRASTKTEGSKDTRGTEKGQGASISSGKASHIPEANEAALPSMEDLKQEEEEVRKEEKAEVERKRQIAQKVAIERGLGSDGNGSTVGRPHGTLLSAHA